MNVEYTTGNRFILIMLPILMLAAIQCETTFDPNGDGEDEVTPQELEIMPLGDSLTEDPRGRIQLWNLLTDDGHTVDFVGDQHQESDIPDPDHEGVGGIKIHEIADKAESLMERHGPEYVNLMVGTNDIAGGFDEPAEEMADRWNDLVQTLLDSSPEGTWIVAATIPPVTSQDVGSEDLEIQDRAVMTEAYNELIRQHVADRRDAGDRIVLADMEAEMNVEEHVFEGDGVHLTTQGYEVMGQVYYEAITRILREN